MIEIDESVPTPIHHDLADLNHARLCHTKAVGTSMFEPFVWRLLAVLGLVIILPFLWLVIPAIIRRKRYQASTYRRLTGASYGAVVRDRGRYGEYLTGQELGRLPGYHRTLYNLYVPRADGTTSEIDIVFLHSSGIYVVESKNYSGHIYGSHNDRQWTVTLAGGRRKQRFFNPVHQNQGHIAALTTYLPWLNRGIVHSLVVFSVRCTLAKVPSSNAATTILRRNHLVAVLGPRINDIVLTNEQVAWLFNALQPLTHVDPAVMTKHIANVAITRAAENEHIG